MGTVEIKDLVIRDGLPAKGSEGGGKKATSKPAFEVVALSGADFAVRRTCGKGSKLLAVIVSQRQYYVKDERSGDVSPLDEKTYASFLRGCGGRVFVGAPWVSALLPYKAFKDTFLADLRDPLFCALAESGLWSIEPPRGWRTPYNKVNRELARFLSANPALARTLREVGAHADMEAREELAGMTQILSDFMERFGLDRTRDFLRRYKEAGFPPFGYRQEMFASAVGKIFEAVPTMPFGKFLDYLFDASQRQGCFEPRWLPDWASTWADTLEMETLVSGKVVDRYPDCLLTYHQILACECAKRREEVDRRKWERAVAAMARFEWGNGSYTVLSPKTPDDMRIEAARQSNCLAGYIKSVVRGAAWIFFLRKADSPDESYVTVEVSPKSKNVVQAKMRFNRNLDEQARKALAEWAEAVGLHAAA